MGSSTEGAEHTLYQVPKNCGQLPYRETSVTQMLLFLNSHLDLGSLTVTDCYPDLGYTCWLSNTARCPWHSPALFQQRGQNEDKTRDFSWSLLLKANKGIWETSLKCFRKYIDTFWFNQWLFLLCCFGDLVFIIWFSFHLKRGTVVSF